MAIFQLSQVYVRESTTQASLQNISQKIQPLGYNASRMNIDEDDVPPPDCFQDYSDFTQRERFVYYMMQIQSSIEMLVNNLAAPELSECLSPLKGKTPEDEMNRLAFRYL